MDEAHAHESVDSQPAGRATQAKVGAGEQTSGSSGARTSPDGQVPASSGGIRKPPTPWNRTQTAPPAHPASQAPEPASLGHPQRVGVVTSFDVPSLTLPPSPASLVEVSLGESCIVESVSASGCELPLLPQAAAKAAVPTMQRRIASRFIFQGPHKY